MRQQAIFLLLMSLLLLAIPLACQKNYSVAPLPAPTFTPTVTSTPTCNAPPQSLPCASGIMWGYGQVVSQINNGTPSGSYAELLLAVNCVPFSTAGVTLTGPGITLPLSYYGTTALGGTTYADYNSTQPVTFTAGNTYTLTSVTTSGTASASLIMPSTPNISTDGLTITWAGPAMFTLLGAYDDTTSTLTYESSMCWSATSPASVPASAYPATGTYSVGAECFNYTTSITGGSGIYSTEVFNDQTVNK